MSETARSSGILIWICAAVVLLQGCATAPPRMNPLPEDLAEQAVIPGIPRARSWGDKTPKYIDYWANAPDETIRESFGGIMGREHYYLAISGGGSDGAFGAGLLNGWTESGTRPEFTLVTGISTGGLIAPFAFLGPAYDEKMKEIFTSYSTSDLVTLRRKRNIIFNDSAADTAPLRAKIAEHVDAIERGLIRKQSLG